MPKIRLVESKTWKEDAEKQDIAIMKAMASKFEVVGEAEAKNSGADDHQRVLRFTISDESVDRDNDTVSVEGWNLKNYKQNPVVLWAHDYSELPLGKSLSVRRSGDALVSVAEFAPRDLSEKADTVFRMLKAGYLRATSVGFIPTEYKESDDPERKAWYGYDFLKQDLLEYSVVPVPSNPNALIDAHKNGINTASLKSWAERVLDLKQPLHGFTLTEMEDAWSSIMSKAIYIDLKAAEPESAEPVELELEEAIQPVVATCPECSESVSLALPVDGAEVVHRCVCGSAWKVTSCDLVDVSDYGGEWVELSEEPESFDIDVDIIGAAAERLASEMREKLKL